METPSAGSAGADAPAPAAPASATVLVNLAIVAMALVIVTSIWLVSGRITEEGGLGFDGRVYARMMVESLDRGGANARLRPLVILVNQLAFDFVFQDAIRTFVVMNFVYSGLLALVLVRILDVYRVPPAHKAVFVANVFATIAVTKMFAFYPVLIDLGAYLCVAAAVYAILRGRRLAILAATMLAVFAREFGLVVILFGIHRDLRRGVSWRVIAGTYAPALAAFVALRQWVAATSSGQGAEGTLLSIADVIANLRFLVDPLFLLFLAYFVLTIFGGVSLLLVLQAARRQLTLRGESEWLTYLGLVGVLSLLGNADLWRYLAYALPAAAALYARSLATLDWRFVAPWAGVVTLFTQQPWTTMNDVSYFEDWFPLYLPLFEVPYGPTPIFWATWTFRVSGVAALCVVLWLAGRDRRELPPARSAPGGVAAGPR